MKYCSNSKYLGEACIRYDSSRYITDETIFLSSFHVVVSETLHKVT